MTPRLRGLVVLASLAPAAAVSLSCRKPVDETRFLNFDEASSAGALVSGWSGWEKTAQGDTFVWAQARTALVRLESRADDDRLVRVRAWPYRYPGAPAQALTLFLNDVRVESAPMGDGPRVYTFLAPKAAFKEGGNDVRLEFTYSEAPRDREPGSPDARTLAAGVDWIEVVPPRRGAGADGGRGK